MWTACAERSRPSGTRLTRPLKLCSIYIGGGTPTSLSAAQLRQLMGTVRDCFDLSTIVEYTVEAGRPDCTDAEKLAVIKEYGATRISINPQTFSDEVLENIGRKHSAQDILDCYAEARAQATTTSTWTSSRVCPATRWKGSKRACVRLSPSTLRTSQSTP